MILDLLEDLPRKYDNRCGAISHLSVLRPRDVCQDASCWMHDVK